MTSASLVWRSWAGEQGWHRGQQLVLFPVQGSFHVRISKEYEHLLAAFVLEAVTYFIWWIKGKKKKG